MTLTAPHTDLAVRTERWPALQALSAGGSQRIFRCCLTALSRPGLVQTFDVSVLPSQVPAVAAPLLALTDLMTPIVGLAEAADSAHRIAAATGATLSGPDRARFALALSETEEMSTLSVGTNWSPENGTMLCQRVRQLSEWPTVVDHDLVLRISGPGVKESTCCAVAGLGRQFFDARAELTAGFPRGIDVLLVADDGSLVGLPRTASIEVL